MGRITCARMHYAQACVYAYVRVCVCMCPYMYECVYIHICIYVTVCIYVRVYAYANVALPVYVYWMCMYQYLSISLSIYPSTFPSTYVLSSRWLIHSLTHSLMQKFMPSFMHSFIHFSIIELLHFISASLPCHSMHQFIQSFIHSIDRACCHYALVHSFARSFIHYSNNIGSFIQSVSHAFIHFMLSWSVCPFVNEFLPACTSSKMQQWICLVCSAFSIRGLLFSATCRWDRAKEGPASLQFREDGHTVRGHSSHLPSLLTRQEIWLGGQGTGFQDVQMSNLWTSMYGCTIGAHWCLITRSSIAKIQHIPKLALHDMSGAQPYSSRHWPYLASVSKPNTLNPRRSSSCMCAVMICCARLASRDQTLWIMLLLLLLRLLLLLPWLLLLLLLLQLLSRFRARGWRASGARKEPKLQEKHYRQWWQ